MLRLPCRYSTATRADHLTIEASNDGVSIYAHDGDEAAEVVLTREDTVRLRDYLNGVLGEEPLADWERELLRETAPTIRQTNPATRPGGPLDVAKVVEAIRAEATAADGAWWGEEGGSTGEKVYELLGKALHSLADRLEAGK